MAEEYLGILGPHDPLYDVLASRVLPGVRNPVFHVSRMSSRNTVYKYTEEKTGRTLVGKFFARRSDLHNTAISQAGEYDNLEVMRSYGFDTSPHFVVRPISREVTIGLALVEEFVDGHDLDHYFKQAVNGKNRGCLEARLSRLASFLYAFHRNTELAGCVDLEAQSEYFLKILDTLCKDMIIPPSGRCRYLDMRDIWLNNRVMKVSRRQIVHGDPTPTNFIFTHNGDIVAIDLERMKEADAVFDLGMVCAETKHAFFWRTGNRYASEPYITYFFSRYASHFADPAAAFKKITQRNPFYMALAELRIARNHYLDVEYRKRLAFEALECLEHGLALL